MIEGHPGGIYRLDEPGLTQKRMAAVLDITPRPRLHRRERRRDKGPEEGPDHRHSHGTPAAEAVTRAAGGQPQRPRRRTERSRRREKSKPGIELGAWPWRGAPPFLCAGHERQLGGESPLPILTEEKG